MLINYKDSLEYRFPDIAKEWDYEKNLGLTPKEVSYGSNQIVFWKCPICKQSYPKKINNRTAPSKIKSSKTNRCPVCLGRYIIPEYNSLQIKFPELIAAEWDYNKNTIHPSQIAPFSNKKVWWKCSNGHSYQSTPNNKIRNNGGNCPYCSHQKLSPEYSLAVVNPKLAAEWDYEANAPITPYDVFASSNKYAKWVCPICSYKWSAKICNRTNGRGCPNCAKGQHSSFPEQVIYHYVKQVFPDSINGYKLGRTEIDIYIPSLHIGIEYDGEAYHHTLKRYKNDIKKNHFLSENGITLIRFREAGCYPMDNEECIIYNITYTSDYTYLVKPLKALITSLSPNTVINIDIDSVRNDLLSQLHILPYEQSFAAYAENCQKQGIMLKALWDDKENYPLLPEMVTPKSAKVVSWICINDATHKWMAPVASISNGYGCSICAKRYQYKNSEWIDKASKIHKNKYDYSKTNYSNGKTPVIIICPIHGEFLQQPTEHLQGKGCKYCANQAFHPKNSLAALYPDIAKEWDFDLNKESGFTPKTIGIDTRRKFYWHCDKGLNHSYQATIAARVHRNSGCAVCHGKQVVYETSLAYLRSDLLEEWSENNTIKPTEVTIGSEKKVWWKCHCPEHPAYKASIYDRVNRKVGCPMCSGNIKSPKTYAREVSEKFPHIELLLNYQKSSIRVTCRCKVCGYEWSPFPYNLLKSKGCPKCK